MAVFYEFYSCRKRVSFGFCFELVDLCSLVFSKNTLLNLIHFHYEHFARLTSKLCLSSTSTGLVSPLLRFCLVLQTAHAGVEGFPKDALSLISSLPFSLTYLSNYITMPSVRGGCYPSFRDKESSNYYVVTPL